MQICRLSSLHSATKSFMSLCTRVKLISSIILLQMISIILIVQHRGNLLWLVALSLNFNKLHWIITSFVVAFPNGFSNSRHRFVGTVSNQSEASFYRVWQKWKFGKTNISRGRFTWLSQLDLAMGGGGGSAEGVGNYYTKQQSNCNTGLMGHTFKNFIKHGLRVTKM